VRPTLLLPQDRIEILSVISNLLLCCNAIKLPELVNGV
jgi:hypothetical protein